MVLVQWNRDASTAQVRQFALMWLPGVCLAFASWSAYRGHGGIWVAAFVLVALISLAVGLLRPDWARWTLIVWLGLTFPLAWIVAMTLMLVVYFLILTPIGLVRRAVGRDPLSRAIDREATSYWITRESPRDVGRYFRQY